MELRKEIERTLRMKHHELYGAAPLPDCFALADAILAIPEIQEALEYTDRMTKHFAKMMADDIAKLPIKVYRP